MTAVSEITRLFSRLEHLKEPMRSLWVVGFMMTALMAERIESYIDETGVKVFTNIGTQRALQTPDPVGNGAASPRAADPLPSALQRGLYYFPLIEDLAGRYGVDDQLVKAIISVESNYDPLAVSPKNCKGLMQLHPDTARRFGVLDVFDPAQNIEGGVRYLRFLKTYFENDIPLILAAYNAGENAVTRHQGIPPYRETQQYVRKVQDLYRAMTVSQTAAEPEPSRSQRRIHRVVTAKGRVVFTNTPEVVLN